MLNFPRWLMLVIGLWGATGCSTIQLARGDKGFDVSQLHPGLTRAEAEALVGPPVREWQSPTGISYRLHEYASGFPPQVGDAVVLGFVTALSLGLMEVSGREYVKKLNTARSRLVLSYDENDVVLGVFEEFDELSIDGRSNRPAVEG